MEPRFLGQTDLRIPPVVFGAMARHPQSDDVRVEVLRAAIDRGLTAIDTAPLYDFGQAERQLGVVLQNVRRDRVQIFTKVGLRWDAGAHGEVLFAQPAAAGGRVVRMNSRPESVRWEVEQSLTRLGVDVLDLVHIHQPDVHTPIAETMGALLKLRAEGKLRHVGVSNFSLEQVRAAQAGLGEVTLCSVQPEYSLVRRHVEQVLLPWCVQSHVGVLAYSPLAGGLLAGGSDASASAGIREVIDRTLRPIAQSHGASLAAVALAWVYGQEGVTAAITGASSTAQVGELAGAVELDLSTDEITRLTEDFAGAPLILPGDPPRSLLARALRKAGRFGARLVRRAGAESR